MWPSQRLTSIGLDSWQGVARARRRDRRGIRPIVTLLEERTLLSTLNLTVTTLLDDPTTPIPGQVTLRDAINTANADTVDSQEIISFAAGLHGTIDLTQALPNLVNNISINGPGASSLIVNGNDANFSVFTVNSGETNISGVTITGGGGSSFEETTVFVWGGGITNNGTLIVNGCIFTSNSANSVTGGGAILNSGLLTVTNSTFYDDSANINGGMGGAICTSGPLTIIGSTFSNNSAGWGGAICSSNIDSLTVTNCTFSNDSANSIYGRGGAIDSSGPLTVTGSTFSNNSAYIGGAISSETTTVSNSTFTSNSATYGGAISTSDNLIPPDTLTLTITTIISSAITNNHASNDGGGIYYTDTLTFDSATAVAGNTASLGANIFDPVPIMSVTDNSGPYNSTAFVATATINSQSSLEGITPTLDYEQLINGTWTNLGVSAPVNAGSYEVTANFAGSTDYTAASSTVDFNIIPAIATISVTPISGLVYEGTWLPTGGFSPLQQETVNYSAIGVNGALPNSDFTDTTVHANAGTYNDTWTFTDPNYISQSGAVTDTIAKANVQVYITPSTEVYDGGPQNLASGNVYAPGGPNAGFFSPSNLVINATHTNVGTYTDSWAFTSPTGNFNDASGTMIDTMTPATAHVSVMPYNVTFNGNSHVATGTVTGINGALPSSDLTLNTTHTNAGTYTDTWIFSDPNYVSQHGIIQDVITANPPAVLMTTLYQEILGRAPDAAGLTSWVNAVNSGDTVAQIANSFWNSPEHLAHPIGNLNTATLDASNAFVSVLYQDILGRTGDTGGIACWDQVLNSNSAMTPNQVAMDFWNSSEHQAKLKAGTAPASTYSISVTALYNELLGRSPDTSGLNVWVNIQYSGALTMNQMVQGFANSAEFVTRTSSLSTSAVITCLYKTVLNRTPDAAGLAAWDQALNSGTVTRTQAVQGFWDSPEHAQVL